MAGAQLGRRPPGFGHDQALRHLPRRDGGGLPDLRGQALVRCPKTVACEACGGTGRFFTRQGPPETCLTCRGFKKVTCEVCHGIGKRPCASCSGGQVGCPSCGATGFFTGYQEGRIQRTIDHTTVRAGAGKAVVRAADVDLYQLVPTSDQAPDLSLLPGPALAELTVELARRVPGSGAGRYSSWRCPSSP